jgi:hypothetical protein
MRKKLNSVMLLGIAVPTAPIPKITAVMTRIFFLPSLSERPAPIRNGPMRHPITALLTAKPTSFGVRLKSLRKKITAPETIERSYPNRNPPTAAIIEIPKT